MSSGAGEAREEYEEQYAQRVYDRAMEGMRGISPGEFRALIAEFTQAQDVVNDVPLTRRQRVIINRAMDHLREVFKR